mgnify:CR=1 FL=1
MICFVIGSFGENEVGRSEFECMCRTIGRDIFSVGHSLAICSLFDDSADYWILDGYINHEEQEWHEPHRVFFHYMNVNGIDEQIKAVKDRLANPKVFVQIPHSPLSENVDIQLSWLYCQLEALEQSHCVIAVGGNKNGSSSLLLACADQKRKLVIPFPEFRGAAEEYLIKHQYELKERLNISSLEQFWNSKLLCKSMHDYLSDYILSKDSREKTIKNIRDIRIFLSYSRERPEEADFIENIFYRKKISIFRDDTSFGAGVELSANIKEQLYNADVCIILWCAEYACSPWCNDEMEFALDRKENKHMSLWIICLDDTRIVPKRARSLLTYRVHSRAEIEGYISKLLEHA